MSAAQKDPDRSQTATMPEHDLPTRPITHDDMARMIGVVMDERAKVATAPAASVITGKQWTAIGSGLVAVLGIFGGANYAGVAQLTQAEVTARDVAHRAGTRKELEAVLVKVDKRVDEDRAAFKAEVGAIKKDMAETKTSIGKIESYISILKDRETRK